MQSRDVYVLKELWPLTLLKDNSCQFENAYLFDKRSRSERKSPNFWRLQGYKKYILIWRQQLALELKYLNEESSEYFLSSYRNEVISAPLMNSPPPSKLIVKHLSTRTKKEITCKVLDWSRLLENKRKITHQFYLDINRLMSAVDSWKGHFFLTVIILNRVQRRLATIIRQISL